MRKAFQFLESRRGETSGAGKVEIIEEEDLAENIEEAFQQLKVDGKVFKENNWFETFVNPSISLRRSTSIASLCAWSLWIFILFPVWWRLTSVQKSPLPRNEIYKLQKSVAKTIKQLAKQKSYNFNSVDDAIRSLYLYNTPVVLLPLCEYDEVSAPAFRNISDFVQPSLSNLFPPTIITSTKSLSQYEKVVQFCNSPEKEPPTNEILLLLNSVYFRLLPKSFISTHPYFILYHTNPSTESIVFSDSPIAFISSPTLDTFSPLANSLIFSVWFESDHSIIQFPSPIRSQYSWSFLLVGNGNRRISWNFESDVKESLLHPFLSSIQRFTTIEISSHVVVDGDFHSLFKHKRRSQSSPAVFTVDDLSRLQSLAYGWKSPHVLSKPTNSPPDVLNFALYLQRGSDPVIRLKSQSGILKKSCSVSRWGALVIPDCENCSESTDITIPTRKELESAVSMWTTHWRQLLGLPSIDLLSYIRSEPTLIGKRLFRLSRNRTTVDINNRNSFFTRASIEFGSESHTVDIHIAIPQGRGITDWELNRMGRHSLWTFLSDGVSLLASLLEVVDAKSDLLVERQLSERTKNAVDMFQLAFKYIHEDASNRDLWTALNQSRLGYQLAKESLHDPTTTSATFFNFMFKSALYLPVLFPYVLPLIMIWTRYGQEIGIQTLLRKAKNQERLNKIVLMAAQFGLDF